MMTSEVMVFVVAVIAGAIAAISGFGIGTILTPLLAIAAGAQLAVALASVPHLIGTAVRFTMLRRFVDWRLFWSFGVLSAAGAAAGALMNAIADTRVLAIVLGALVVIVGVSAMTGWPGSVTYGRKTAWVGGAVSGFFGGFVGNQGGLRSAALLGFPMPKENFIATATAIGLIVDAARIPIYAVTHGSSIGAWAGVIASASGGVLVGTIAGSTALRRIPQALFRRLVGAALIVLGIYIVAKSLYSNI